MLKADKAELWSTHSEGRVKQRTHHKEPARGSQSHLGYKKLIYLPGLNTVSLLPRGTLAAHTNLLSRSTGTCFSALLSPQLQNPSVLNHRHAQDPPQPFLEAPALPKQPLLHQKHTHRGAGETKHHKETAQLQRRAEKEGSSCIQQFKGSF